MEYDENNIRDIPFYLASSLFSAGLAQITKMPAMPEFSRNYGLDLFEPFIAYNILRGIGCGKIVATCSSLVLPFAVEIGQREGSFAGTYDPRDFIAYSLGVGLAILSERGYHKIKKRLSGASSTL